MKNHCNSLFPNKMIMLGFGSIGQAVLPLLFRHLKLQATQLLIMTKDTEAKNVASDFGISPHIVTITKENYLELLVNELKAGDFLLNLSVDISSMALVQLCQQKGVLYLDASIEPWRGGYVDNSLAPALRSNYALRETILPFKKPTGPTAVLTHGANPGLVSHFVKQALWNMAQDCKLETEHPKTASEWATMAQMLDIKVIHVAEHDTQISATPKCLGEFANTWSVDGFVSESGQPAELSWGSHEQHWPHNACEHTFGSKAAIYINQPGASVKVRSWTPSFGPFHGFLISHGEAISLGNYLTLQGANFYRPTIHYVYLPCPDARLSLHEFQGNEWQVQAKKRVLFADITQGEDELGVLLMGNKNGAYWYGSCLSITAARQLVPHNNATSLQVAAGVLAGVMWAIQNPNQGIVEPEDMDYAFILEVALPYLGKVGGYYTDWTPLQNREKLFAETLDRSDPWQFINMRV